MFNAYLIKSLEKKKNKFFLVLFLQRIIIQFFDINKKNMLKEKILNNFVFCVLFNKFPYSYIYNFYFFE